MPEPDRSRLHSGSYTSAVPDQACPLLLRLAWSCSLCFGFPMQRCAQPLNSWCTVVKIPPTSEPPLFHPDRCRACSTAECTATNILAPIACAHHAAPHTPAPCSLLLLLAPAPAPAPRLRSSTPRAPCSSCSLLFAPAPCSCSLRSCSSRLCSLLLTRAPCSPCSSRSCSLHLQLPFRLWCCSRTFPSTMCARYSIFRLCFSALSLAPWTLLLLV